MSRRTHAHSKSVANLCLSPNLGGEIMNWNKARIDFQHNPAKVNRDYYCKCCDELGQAISQWSATQPELFEQFKLWFESHPEY
jgi:hypothetical protein